MERIQQTLVWDENELKNSLSALSLLTDSFCVFDIETTGLSPQVSSLYLLGVAYMENNRLTLIQWFADDYTSEKEILREFAKTISSFSTVVHYNGSTFDIPYLEKKYAAHHLPSPFENKSSLDIYRRLNKQKHWFEVPNLKLTTAETLVHFNRHDTFTGKECIKLYTDFMQKKYFKDEDSLRIKKELLLHNHDDILGTLLCSQLLPFVQYTPVNPSYTQTEDSFVLTDFVQGVFPLSLNIKNADISCSFQESAIRIEIPLFEGTLYHFFDDYKNYYYLPDEDMAVHKSVGIYVDASHRQKATASNCYVKKTGTFLPLPKKLTWNQFSLFKKDKKDAVCYLDLEDKSLTFTREMLVELITKSRAVL